MIPPVIHYCWFGRKPLPLEARKCIRSWKRVCPDYEIRCWNESNFDVSMHSFMKSAYESKAWAFVSDYARLKIIYDNGGIYLDTDVELIKSVDTLRTYQCYLGIQQHENLCATGLGFGAVKSNVVIKLMLEQYDGLVYADRIKKEIACPYLNNRVLDKLGYCFSEKPTEIDGTLILPSRYLDPIAPGKDTRILQCEDTYSIHHYSASWMGKKTRLRRKIIRFLGQDNVIKCKHLFRK